MRIRNWVLGAVLGAAVFAAPSRGIAGDADDMDARYAEYEQSTQGGLLSRLLSSSRLLGTADRLTRAVLRITAGEINPTNVATFDDDFKNACVAALDERLHLSEAHEAATGRGVTVAVLDGGFDTDHEAIRENLLPYGYDAVDQDLDPNDAGNGHDDDGDGVVDLGVGHGTFVCGALVAAAPDVRILPVRIADDEGYGTEEEVLRGIRFAMDMEADIINLSFEAGLLPERVLWRLRDAADAGALVVVSAGNGGRDDLGRVADSSFTLSVGAVDFDDRVADFSNTAGDGQELTVFAPGVDLYGPWHHRDRWCVWSGTSFASPLAAGALALARERDPGLRTAGARELLRAAAAPVVDRDGAPYSGAGRLDAARMVGR